jgi:glucosyl-dolichyl phosphate glucuronosyltransferase
VKISSIICTRNRATYLAQAIRSLAEQDITPRSDYEIIVVDNGSTDATRAVVTELVREIPCLRYIHEPNEGLSAARNRGVKEALAPIVAFLDDDALAVKEWLGALLRAFSVEPQPVCVGGPVEPWWEVPKPRWFPDGLIGCHNRNHGDVARWYNYPAEQPVGCNMAFLKQRVQQVGGFNALLQKYNDETELLSRLVEANGRMFYEPRARVRHLFAKERFHLGWQIKRHYQEGKSRAIVSDLKAHPPRIRRVTELGRNLLLITKRSIPLVVSRASRGDRIQRLAQLSMVVGQTVGLTKSLRER